MDYYDVEQVYEDFWEEIICDSDGNIDIEQVKKELCDYYNILQQVPKVYNEITGGWLSKPSYQAETVLDVFREKYANKVSAVHCLHYDWDIITADCETNADYKKAIFEYLEIEE